MTDNQETDLLDFMDREDVSYEKRVLFDELWEKRERIRENNRRMANLDKKVPDEIPDEMLASA